MSSLLKTAPRSVPSGWTTAAGEAVRAAGRGVRQSAYQLECSEWLAGIAADGTPGPRAFFQLRAAHLAEVGALPAYRHVREWVETNLAPLVGRRPGGTDEADAAWRISRIDLAADVVGVRLTGSDLHAFTTRASRRRAYDEPAVSDYVHRDFTGFRFGRRGGPIFCRLYKKSAEAADDAWVRDVWRASGYRPVKHGPDVWRVEFELRGGLLRELTVDGAHLPRHPAEVLSHHLTNLWAYASRQWLVLHDTARTRVERDPVAPWWAALGQLEGFDAEPRAGTKLGRVSPPAGNPRQLVLMAVGALSSLAALQGQQTWEEVRAGLDRYVKNRVGEAAFAQAVERKASAHEPQAPLPAHWLDVLLADEPIPDDWFGTLAPVEREQPRLPPGAKAWRSGA